MFSSPVQRILIVLHRRVKCLGHMQERIVTLVCGTLPYLALS